MNHPEYDFDPVTPVQLTLEGKTENAEEFDKLVPKLYAVNKHDAVQLYEGIQQLGQYILQMGGMMATMQRRLDELEEKQARITLSHEEVKAVSKQISRKVCNYCEKYDILTPGSMRTIRAGIKRSILDRYHVKDLHDVPAAALPAVETQIEYWSDSRLMMKCRERIRAG